MIKLGECKMFKKLLNDLFFILTVATFLFIVAGICVITEEYETPEQLLEKRLNKIENRIEKLENKKGL
jgi:hypothetical protein